jgi:transposase
MWASMEGMVAHIEGECRQQRLLFAPSLDEQVGAEHPVRVIDAFVDGLDLAELGFSKVAAEATGRPPYQPGDLLKLYVYGYLNQLRSSRRLEREAVRNLEVLWLIRRLSPSFKTIADFRRDHPAAIVGVCRAFVRFCREQSLYGGELLAIDGTKIAAVASRKKVITPKSLEKRLTALDAKIAEYLAAMDVADRAEAPQAEPGDVATALAALRAKRQALQEQAEALATDGLAQRVVGERDAKLMRTARHGHQVAYNAQTAVDAKHGLIAAFELTNHGNDHQLLLPTAMQGKQALAAEAVTVVADTGYANGEQGQACAEAGITAVVPRPSTVNPKDDGLFSRDAFAYDAASDSWTCPAGHQLVCQTRSAETPIKKYATKACASCALKPQCTKSAGRVITRDRYEDARQAMHQRALNDPRWMQRRRELAEHPFGVMKWIMGCPRFLVRGSQKANSELALVVLGFNLKRAIAVRGIPALLAALQAAAA